MGMEGIDNDFVGKLESALEKMKTFEVAFSKKQSELEKRESALEKKLEQFKKQELSMKEKELAKKQSDLDAKEKLHAEKSKGLDKLKNSQKYQPDVDKPQDIIDEEPETTHDLGTDDDQDSMSIDDNGTPNPSKLVPDGELKTRKTADDGDAVKLPDGSVKDALMGGVGMGVGSEGTPSSQPSTAVAVEDEGDFSTNESDDDFGASSLEEDITDKLQNHANKKKMVMELEQLKNNVKSKKDDDEEEDDTTGEEQPDDEDIVSKIDTKVNPKSEEDNTDEQPDADKQPDTGEEGSTEEQPTQDGENSDEQPQDDAKDSNDIVNKIDNYTGQDQEEQPTQDGSEQQPQGDEEQPTQDGENSDEQPQDIVNKIDNFTGEEGDAAQVDPQDAETQNIPADQDVNVNPEDVDPNDTETDGNDNDQKMKDDQPDPQSQDIVNKIDNYTGQQPQDPNAQPQEDPNAQQEDPNSPEQVQAQQDPNAQPQASQDPNAQASQDPNAPQQGQDQEDPEANGNLPQGGVQQPGPDTGAAALPPDGSATFGAPQADDELKELPIEIEQFVKSENYALNMNNCYDFYEVLINNLIDDESLTALNAIYDRIPMKRRRLTPAKYMFDKAMDIIKKKRMAVSAGPMGAMGMGQMGEPQGGMPPGSDMSQGAGSPAGMQQ